MNTKEEAAALFIQLDAAQQAQIIHLIEILLSPQG